MGHITVYDNLLFGEKTMSNNLPAIRKMITGDGMQAMIQQRIGDKAGVFTTSLLDLIGDNTSLQQCDINLVSKKQ